MFSNYEIEYDTSYLEQDINERYGRNRMIIIKPSYYKKIIHSMVYLDNLLARGNLDRSKVFVVDDHQPIEGVDYKYDNIKKED